MNGASIITLAFVIALNMGDPAVSYGQQPGQLFDPVQATESTIPDVRCFIHERTIVVERNLTEAVGADLFVRARALGRCDADSLRGDLVLRNDWAQYFMGIRGHVLFIDSGTGPDIRELRLVDIRDRRRILDIDYVDLEPGPDSSGIGIWRGYELGQTAPGCPPPAGGLLPGIDSLFIANIRTGDIRFAERTRCAVRQ
jgi:hypothetical protein